MIAAITIILFYVGVVFADFLAYADPHKSEAQRSLLPPQPIHWYDGDTFRPHVFGLTGKRDLATFKRVYQPDPDLKVPLKWWVEGYEYKLLGLVKTNRHRLGVEGARAEDSIFRLGTDLQGRICIKLRKGNKRTG